MDLARRTRREGAPRDGEEHDARRCVSALHGPAVARRGRRQAAGHQPFVQDERGLAAKRTMKLYRIMAIIERDMRKFFRSPALMMTSMVFPLMQLIVLGYAFGGQIKNVRIALVDEDHGPESRLVRERLNAIVEGPAARSVVLLREPITLSSRSRPVRIETATPSISAPCLRSCAKSGVSLARPAASRCGHRVLVDHHGAGIPSRDRSVKSGALSFFNRARPSRPWRWRAVWRPVLQPIKPVLHVADAAFEPQNQGFIGQG